MVPQSFGAWFTAASMSSLPRRMWALVAMKLRSGSDKGVAEKEGGMAHLVGTVPDFVEATDEDEPGR